MKLTEARLKRMVAEQTFANLFEKTRPIAESSC